MPDAVQFMLSYFHLDGYVTKETGMTLLYAMYYYGMADFR